MVMVGGALCFAPLGSPPPERPPQPKACSPGESACHHLAPLKKEGAFGQPDRAGNPPGAGILGGCLGGEGPEEFGGNRG